MTGGRGNSGSEPVTVDQMRRNSMRYYKIVDDCGWTHYIAVEDDVQVFLAPHTRSADPITKEEYEKNRRNYHESCK